MTALIVLPRGAFGLRRSLHLRILCAVCVLVASATCTTAGSASAFGPFPEQFGPESFGVYTLQNALENQDGLPAIQAGSHPYSMTTTITFNHMVTDEVERYIKSPKGKVPEGLPEVTANIFGAPKNVQVNLPQGMIVNPNATPIRCTEAELETRPNQGGGCPAASTVGVATPFISKYGEQIPTAIYNMVPPPGVAAEFGADPGEVGVVFHIFGRARTGEDYGLTGEVYDLTEKVPVYGAKLVFWGDPTAESHDAYRGVCAPSPKVLKEVEEEYVKDGLPQFALFHFNCPLTNNERTEQPLLTMPGSCTGEELTTTVDASSWQEASNVIGPPAANTMTGSPAVTGCDQLRFDPSLDVRPSSEPVATETSSGLNVDLRFPQLETEELAEANLKTAVVTLPAGFAVSPSAANGLGACPRLFGREAAKEAMEEKKEIVGINLDSRQPANCPDSSKVGDAEVTTPLLEAPLKGAVYLARQDEFEHSLIGLYLVVEGSGQVVKLGGKVELGEPGVANGLQLGQIRATFDDNPQLPFSDLKLKFFPGPRAPLVTPSTCGTYAVSSQLTPWSSSMPFEPEQHGFSVAGGCSQGFSPAFSAGTTTIQAGAYTPFSLTLSRQNGEQRFGTVRVTMPSGLLANLRSVPRCAEPQAYKGECGPESLIGESTAAAGPGPDPFWVRGGKVYLTGPYGGDPFGLSVVVPAVAGPFDLGDVVARAGIGVDSHTAQAIVTSSIPTIKDGIPLDVRTINVTIDRPGFVFNPTDCAPSSVSAIVSSTVDSSTAVSSPFDVANCAALPFKPSFAVSTPAKTSKANGAGLTVRVASGAGQANISKVRVTLPKQLPARLTTLQKACTETVFNADPALCPPASIVATATAVTPVLAHPLTGPAYLVSHGGAAFPDLVFVLQGEGIKLYLDGNTNIKKGITTSTFNSVPDAPISTFETVFPEGPHSVLATNIPAKAKGSMCRQKLTMPTTITGQNGAVLAQTTKISVTGCPKKPKPKKVSGKRKK